MKCCILTALKLMRLSVRNISWLLFATMIIASSCSKKDSPPPNTPPPSLQCINGVSPANGSFIANSFNVTFSWNAVQGASTYDIYLGTTPQPGTKIATDLSSTSFSYTVPSIPNVTYYWYVQPKNPNNSISCSNISPNSFTPIVIQAPPAFGYYVIGYFPYYRNPAEVPDVKFRMCNVVNYAFFDVNSSGTLDVNSPATLTTVIDKARANNAKIFVSVNDETSNEANFKSMASTANGRTNFIRDVMSKVRQYGFDGVDIDWEFPSTADGTDATFTELMRELSDSLHRDARYYLSAAIVSGKYAGQFRDAIKSEVFAYADWFNIMAYDDFSTTVPYRHHSDYTLATVCLNYWLNTRSMPPAKTVLGFPAYGRPSGITQSGTVLAYRTILEQGGNPQLDSAIVSAPGFPNYMIYYNGQYTVKRKAKLAKDIANGVMMWEKWQDAIDANSLLKAACDTVGRVY